MNETHAAEDFILDVLTTYIWLYAAFVAAKDDNVEFINVP